MTGNKRNFDLNEEYISDNDNLSGKNHDGEEWRGKNHDEEESVNKINGVNADKSCPDQDQLLTSNPATDCSKTQNPVRDDESLNEADLHQSDNHEENDQSTDMDDEYIRKEVCRMEFDSLDDAELFYKQWGRMQGFGIRKQDFKRNAKGEINKRLWVCSCEGSRRGKKLVTTKYHPRPETRFDCNACFTVAYNKSKDMWDVRKFNDKHSHKLTPLEHVQFLRCFRDIPEDAVEISKLLRAVGVGTNKIIAYLARKAGGLDNLNFMPKDLYNRLYRDRALEFRKGDVEAALAFMTGRQKHDSEFFLRYQVDGEECLSHLFWTDGRARYDYRCFGDLLTFDSTYNTNSYGMPLVILAGVNNYHMTTIFGFAVLHDENFETYKWLLEVFLEAMMGKAPISVVTDGDRAMEKAISDVMPEARHRLCAWHIQNNAASKCHTRGFLTAFSQCTYENMEIDAFKQAWRELLIRFKLKKSKWAKRMYKRRRKWAAAYLLGHFWGELRSTQRVEGMNAKVKNGTRGEMRLRELIGYLDVLVDDWRQKEAIAAFHNNYGNPVCVTGLAKVERHGYSIFTIESMAKIVENIHATTGLDTSEKREFESGRRHYQVRHYTSGKSWRVEYSPKGVAIECECRYFKTVGLPCSHIFHVIKCEQLKKIPTCLIVKRWTKGARKGIISVPMVKSLPQGIEARCAKLESAETILNYKAVQTDEGYASTLEKIYEMITALDVKKDKDGSIPKGGGSVRDPKPSTKLRARHTHMTRGMKQRKPGKRKIARKTKNHSSDEEDSPVKASGKDEKVHFSSKTSPVDSLQYEGQNDDFPQVPKDFPEGLNHAISGGLHNDSEFYYPSWESFRFRRGNPWKIEHYEQDRS